MGYLNACSFTFNGTSSKLYDLRICFDGGDSEVGTGLDREVSKGEVNMVRHKANQYGAKYNSVIPIEFMIMKSDGAEFSQLESRTINKWLQTDTYCVLKFDDGDNNNIFYKAICTNIEDRLYGGFIAKYLTFECDSPFAYEELRTFAKSSTETTMRVFNTSDDGVYYPILKLKPLSSGEITITNQTDDSQSMVLDIPAEYVNKDLIIDTSKFQISESGVPIPLHKLGWVIIPNVSAAVQSGNYYWLRLLEEINRIQITGNCTLEIDCEFPRKVGIL